MGRPAVFLDRDGVINELIFNPRTGEFESPHFPGDLCIIPGILDPLRSLITSGFDLFLISNQPSYAKGKTSLENIFEIHRLLDEFLKSHNVYFREYYYCYHHPQGIVPEFSGPCPCRKPAPFFLFKAEKDHGVALSHSWMIGDQDSDMECGRNAGCHTALLRNERSSAKRGQSHPELTEDSLTRVVDQISQINQRKVSFNESS